MSIFHKNYWDSLCNKCGLCCYEKHHRYVKPGKKRTSPSVSSRYYVCLDEPCPFLDEEKKLCTVYQQRFKKCKDCGRLTIFHALFAGYLPADCSYVRRFSFRKSRK